MKKEFLFNFKTVKDELDTDITIIVATNNTAAKSNIKAQQNLLFDNNVEIIGLQEVDNNTKRNPYMLLEKLKTDYYKDIFFSKAMDFSDGEYGIAIASKYKFEATKVEKFSDILESEKIEPRIYQRVVITKAGKRIAFYNTHLSWESMELRKSQMHKLKKSMDNDLCEYVIAVGDFNADQSYKEYDLFKCNYKLVNGNDGIWLDTFNEVDKSMMVNSVDNILISKNIEINDIKMIDSKLSDHNPLIAKLILK